MKQKYTSRTRENVATCYSLETQTCAGQPGPGQPEQSLAPGRTPRSQLNPHR